MFEHLNVTISFLMQVFQGNTDRNTIVKHSLLTAVKARFVRFYYLTYYSWPALRVEIYVYV